MTDLESLIETVRLHPDDDTPRNVLADWLDEHGFSDAADQLRHLLPPVHPLIRGKRRIASRALAAALQGREWKQLARDVSRVQIAASGTAGGKPLQPKRQSLQDSCVQFPKKLSVLIETLGKK